MDGPYCFTMWYTYVHACGCIEYVLGPSINYVTHFWAIFEPPPPCNTFKWKNKWKINSLSYIPTPHPLGRYVIYGQPLIVIDSQYKDTTVQRSAIRTLQLEKWNKNITLQSAYFGLKQAPQSLTVYRLWPFNCQCAEWGQRAV